MTFYEAALRILESEGRPLHVSEITEKSVAQNLLSHVGKAPELTMLSRLAAMARRTRDRRVVCTAKDTFALVDLGIPEDPAALAVTGVFEDHPEENLPPLRPVERHPEPRTENVRAAGRGERKRRREEEEDQGKRRRRFPPVPEVVFEILSDADVPLRADELIERARSRELISDELGAEAMLTALLEDNQRRIDAGRRPQFLFDKDSGQVSLEKAGAPSEAPPLELQAAFAAALGIPLEGGRPVLPRREPAEAAEAGADAALAQTAIAAAKDARRAVARSLRRKLQELDAGTLEKSVVKVLHAFHFRELKVAKRSKEGLLMTARRKEGSIELRYAVRLVKGSQAVDRRMVQEVRKDLSHYSAQIALLLCPGDVRGDARAEAQSGNQLVFLWCGDALADKFLEAKAAVKVTQVELFEVDERFFEAAKLDAEEARKRREERRSERERRGGGPREEREETEQPATVAGLEAEAQAEAGEASAAARVAAEVRAEPAAPSEREDELEEGGEDEGEGEDEHLEAANAFVQGREGAGAGQPGEAGAPGERRRRRRRRRGRRGRGGQAGPPGQAGAPGAGGPSGQGGESVQGDAPGEPIAAAASPEAGPPEPAATAPSGGEGAGAPREASAPETERRSEPPSPAPPAPSGSQGGGE